MDRLRRAPLLARLVLAWLLLSIGAAMAAPLVAPASGQMVCTGSSVQFVITDDGQPAGTPRASLDCPLCLPLQAPPPAAATAAQPPHPLSHACVPADGPSPVARAVAPWQARAPPFKA